MSDLDKGKNTPCINFPNGCPNRVTSRGNILCPECLEKNKLRMEEQKLTEEQINIHQLNHYKERINQYEDVLKEKENVIDDLQKQVEMYREQIKEKDQELGKFFHDFNIDRENFATEISTLKTIHNQQIQQLEKKQRILQLKIDQDHELLLDYEEKLSHHNTNEERVSTTPSKENDNEEVEKVENKEEKEVKVEEVEKEPTKPKKKSKPKKAKPRSRLYDLTVSMRQKFDRTKLPK